MTLPQIRIRDASVKEIQRAFDILVKNVNDLIERQSNVRGSADTSNAKENDIKVERIGEKYMVLIRTKDGWAEQEFNIKES